MSVLTDALDAGVEGYIKIACSVSKSTPVLCTLTDEDIIASSFKLSRQALKESYFTLGGACTSEVTFTLTSYGVAKLKKANLFVVSTCLTIKEWVPVDDSSQSKDDPSINEDGTENTTGMIKLGVFYIQELGNKPANCSVKAFDGMVALGKSITSQDLITFQTPYSLQVRLNQIKEACLTGAYATDLAEITWDTPDASDVTMNTELASDKVDVSTYADMLSQLSILYGGFATFDVDGNLALIRLGVSSETITIPTDIIHGTGVDVSLDYSTKIAVLESSVAGFTVRKPDSIVVEPPLGVLYLPEVGLLRGCQTPRKGNETYVMDTRIDKWLSFIKDIVVNKTFTGGSISVGNRPDIQLGSMLSFKYWGMQYDDDGNGSWVEQTVSDFVVCKIDYSLNNETVLTCNSYQEHTDLGNTGSSIVEGAGSSENTIANAVLLNRNKVSKSGTQKETAILGMNVALTAKMNTYLTTTFKLLFTEDNTSTEQAYLKCYFFVDGKKLLVQPQHPISPGVSTYSFSEALDAYQIDGVHRVDIYISTTLGRWQLQAFDGVLVVMASNIASTASDWTGLVAINETIDDTQLHPVLPDSVPVKATPKSSLT